VQMHGCANKLFWVS